MESNGPPNAKNGQQSGLVDSFSNLYDASYYQFHMGPESYDRSNPIWSKFFHLVAEQIIEELHPLTFLDAGCALGFLVEQLRELGVDARGFDISEFAISSAPEALKPFLSLASLTDEIEGTFDVISCIEVLEHLPESLAKPAITNLCGHTEVVIFSSTPDDFEEPTHLNVRDGGYWAQLFAEEGFFRDFSTKIGKTIAPQAVVFRKKHLDTVNAVAEYEDLLTEKLIQEKQFESAKISSVRTAESDALQRLLELRLVELTSSRAEVAETWMREYQKTRLFRYTKKLRRLYGRVRSFRTPETAEAHEEHLSIYGTWLKTYEPIASEFISESAAALPHGPLVSIIMPTFNTPVEYLEAAISSVLAQSYEHWELCIADDASTDSETREYLASLPDRDCRIKVLFLSTNSHISAASNAAIRSSSGEWIALLDHDDTLVPFALASMVMAASEHPNANLFYSDRDLYEENRGRYQPFFKPDFDRDLLLTLNFVCHFQMMKREIVEKVGGFREGLEGSQDWDLTLRIVAQSLDSQIVHVPYVLYNWRVHSNSVSSSIGAKSYAIESGAQSVRDFLSQTHKVGDVSSIGAGSWMRVDWTLPEALPTVTVVVRGRSATEIEHQKTKLEMMTSYSAATYVGLVLNDATQLTFGEDIHNLMTATDSEFICLFDKTLIPTENNWLRSLVKWGNQEHVGVVGPAIYSKNDRLLHSGIILGLGGSYAELGQGLSRSDQGTYGRFSSTRNYSAVSASCMLIKRQAWESISGASEPPDQRASSNVEFCLRLRSRGQKTLWTQDAILRVSSRAGHELRSDAIDPEEIRSLRERWPSRFLSDPAFNPNLKLDKSNDCLEPAFPPRTIELLRQGRVTRKSL